MTLQKYIIYYTLQNKRRIKTLPLTLFSIQINILYNTDGYICIIILEDDNMRIKEILKVKGLTQQDLAEMLGVSYQSIKQTLNAPSVTTATLEKIASTLNVPVWQLFVSPEEVKGEGELTALIHHNGDFYRATTIAELEEIVEKIKEKH